MTADNEEEGPPTHREGRGSRYLKETEQFLNDTLRSPPPSLLLPTVERKNRIEPLQIAFGFLVGALLAWWLFAR